MKVAFHTLGCKVNQYESQIMAQQFSREGSASCPPAAKPRSRWSTAAPSLPKAIKSPASCSTGCGGSIPAASSC